MTKIGFVELLRYSYQTLRFTWKKYLALIILEFLFSWLFDLLLRLMLPPYILRLEDQQMLFTYAMKNLGEVFSRNLQIAVFILFFFILARFIVSQTFFLFYILVLKEKDTTGFSSIKNMLREAIKLILPFIFITLLYNIFVFFGLVFFIVPGIIIATLFALYPYIFIFDNVRGFSAFWQSYQLIKKSNAVYTVALIILGGLASLLVPVVGRVFYAIYMYNLFLSLHKYETKE